MLNFQTGVGCGQNSSNCQNSTCGSASDFCIKRGDTRPVFRVSVEDCDGVVDLTDANLVLEANMWFKAKLKSDLSSSSSTLSFADNIGFNQVNVGDVILTDRPRNSEKMVVTAIDESAKTLTVERGHDSTDAQDWPRGSLLRVFRFMDQPAQIESVFEQVSSLEGSVSEELVDTFMVFEFLKEHTLLPGCFLLEFSLAMMEETSIAWAKKIPLSSEGYVINIVDSPN
jgi:hypothetical protein